MHSRSTIVAALALFGAVSARPAARSQPDCEPVDPTPPEECKPGSIVAPKIVTLVDSEPDEPVHMTNNRELYLRLGAEGDNREAVALFRGIPRHAKTCKVGWNQRDGNSDKDFKVFDGNGLIEYRSIPVPDKDVYKYSAVHEQADSIEPNHIDMTNWDGADKPARSHSGGNIDCAEEIDLFLTISNSLNDTGGVFQAGFHKGAEKELQGYGRKYKIFKYVDASLGATLRGA